MLIAERCSACSHFAEALSQLIGTSPSCHNYNQAPWYKDTLVPKYPLY